MDLQRQEITHAYCPPARSGSDGFLRPAMWQPGSPFVSLQLDYRDQSDTASPCPSLEFLDFSSGSASPCMVRGVPWPLCLLQPENFGTMKAFHSDKACATKWGTCKWAPDPEMHHILCTSAI